MPLGSSRLRHRGSLVIEQTSQVRDVHEILLTRRKPVKRPTLAFMARCIAGVRPVTWIWPCFHPARTATVPLAGS
ncbi:MAG TPA: hypothetical protein VMN39_02950, partial [Longimicrobiaceae bacterium]|nr:hypothetical protein [Longimicrobiaceae bacterium]